MAVSLVDEAGYTSREEIWHSFEPDSGSLVDTIASATGVPPHEAERIAATAQRKWSARGYEMTRQQRMIPLLTAVVTLFLFPLCVLWIVVWVGLQLT